MQRLVNLCKSTHRELLIGSDCNSHNTFFGSEYTDDRGSVLVDFCIMNNLIILNEGSKPTWYRKITDPDSPRSVIDVTISTRLLSNFIRSWQVLDELSDSDHQWISFVIDGELPPTEAYRSKRKTNWENYILEFGKLDVLKGLSMDMSIEELEEASVTLQNIIMDAYGKSCKLREKKIKCRQSWYNGELQDLRKELRKAFRKAYRTKRPADRERHESLRREYKKRCDKAKVNQWRQHVEKLDNIKDVSRLQKFFETGPRKQLASLVRQDGTFTSNIDETLTTLMETHFPQCVTLGTDEDWEDYRAQYRCNALDRKQIIECTQLSNIIAAIDGFSAFKAPGKDNIFPALLLKGKTQIAPVFQILFRASLLNAYIPELWRGTFVTFIPKAGRSTYGIAGSYRPKSLMSFVLKTLEKIIDKKIRYVDLMDFPLDPDQHAYRVGRGTDSALHSLCHTVEKALDNNYYCMAMFIDIQGAFDKTSTDVLLAAIREKDIPQWTAHWISSMLRNRRVETLDRNCKKKFSPSRGCPQGGCLSPLLWSITIDSLIVELKRQGLKL